MSIITTLLEDGIGAALKLIPSYYLIGAGVVVLAGLLIWAKVWFHNKVEAEAQKEINAYIATKTKDDEALKELSNGINDKVLVKYVDKIKVITKVVHDNASIISQDVPDTRTVLSNGWVSSYNSSVQGLQINPTEAKDTTPSGVTAVDALKVDNSNYGTCLQYKAVAQGWQDWYTQQQDAVSKMNKKDK